jgi:excisionase family DNA binding protein
VSATASDRGSASRLLTAEDVAEIIGMRVDYVYALSRRGQIPHLRFGRTLRFRAEAIEAWLGAAERGTLGRST